MDTDTSTAFAGPELMLTSVSVLDQALDRVSALDVAPPSPFVNHAPMACEALSSLGFDARIDEWARTYESSLVAALQPVTPTWPRDFEWRDLLGRPRLVPEWTGYFERAIADDGWPAVVEVWVPRLTPGLSAALFHGVIRTSHAVRAIRGMDTEPRRRELARALGTWATWFSPGRKAEKASAEYPALDASWAAARGASHYVADPNIFNLHGVTAAMAVQLLAGHLRPGDGSAAVAQLQAEHDGLYRQAPTMTDAAGADRADAWDHEVAVAASESHDAHQIKLVEACSRGFAITHDPAFLVAAEVVTSGR